MKKYAMLFMLCLLLIAAYAGFLYGAQSQLGIKAGWLNSWSRFSSDLPGAQLQSISRIGGGISLWLRLGTGRFGIQTEALYDTNGFDLQETYLDQDISSVYTISYIDIPVMLSYRMFSHGKLQPVLLAGFYFGIPLKVREIQTVDGQVEERELGDNLKNIDAGMVIGLDLKYKLKPFYIIMSARYQSGMTNISRHIQSVSYDFYENDTIKNRSLSLMLGLAINLSP